MKRIRYVCLICLFLIVVVLWLFLVEPFSKPDQMARKIAFVYKDASLYEYQMSQGAKKAADDHQASSFAQYALNTSDWKEQLKNIQKNGYEGILLCCDEENTRLNVICQELGIPVVQLGVSREGTAVIKDDFLLGQQMMECAKRMHLSSLVVFTDYSELTTERMEGFQSVMDSEITIAVSFADEQGMWDLSDAAWDKLQMNAGLIALSENATLWVLQEKEMGNISQQTPLLGLNSAYDISCLENGSVQAMYYAKPYVIGYRGYELMCECLSGERSDQVIRVPYLEVTLENLYEDQNIKTLFPLLE